MEEHALCTTVEERPFRAAFVAPKYVGAFRPCPLPMSCEPRKHTFLLREPPSDSLPNSLDLTTRHSAILEYI